jgi:hypothetical protein
MPMRSSSNIPGRLLPDIGRAEAVLWLREGEDLVLMTRGQSEVLGTPVRALAEVVGGRLERAVAILPRLAFLFPSPGQAPECLGDAFLVRVPDSLAHLRSEPARDRPPALSVRHIFSETNE